MRNKKCGIGTRNEEWQRAMGTGNRDEEWGLRTGMGNGTGTGDMEPTRMGNRNGE